MSQSDPGYNQRRREEFMGEPIESRAVTTVNLAEPFNESGKLPLNFLSGAQQFLREEISYASNEMLARAQVETDLFGEFLQKIAEAHSVNDILKMYQVCGEHQMDFIRRDWVDRFKHARRLIDVWSRGHGNP
jgi:hypothetical protein